MYISDDEHLTEQSLREVGNTFMMYGNNSRSPSIAEAWYHEKQTNKTRQSISPVVQKL
jgi:hypothetical protein